VPTKRKGTAVNPEEKLPAAARRRVPARFRLWFLILVAVAITAALTAGVHYFETRAQNRIFHQLLDSRGRQCSRSLGDFLGPVSRFLNAIEDWTNSGVLDFSDPVGVERQLLPLLERSDNVVSVTLIDPRQGSTRLLREGTTWQRSFLSAGEDSIGVASGLYGPLPVEEVVWSESPDLIARYGWRDPQNQGLRIAALTFAGDTSTRIHRDLSVTPHSLVAILKDDDLVSWLSAGGDRRLHSSTLAQLVNSPDPQQRWIARIFLSWNEAGRPQQRAVPAFLNKKEWRLQVFQLENGGGRMMALAIPRSDLEQQLHALTRPYLYALFASLLLGAGVIVLIFLGYRRRLRNLRRSHDHLHLSQSELREFIDQGESDSLEFKSTLRWNLKANKPGKEIERAWLKTIVAFLNTAGGTLLVGVADDGSIVGTGRDGFRNDDKFLLHFNNCVKEGIGIEFTHFLSFGLKTIEDKEILVVDVEPADEPAFLLLEDDEEFYIRVGPASRKVSPRQALEVLRSRKI